MPFFRWVLTLGLVLIAGSAGVFMSVPDFPDLRQVDLKVLVEAPDGWCTVQWRDPFEHRERTGHYQCDSERDSVLKAPNYEEGSPFGWDSGFVLTEGPDRGELYSLGEDDGVVDWRIDLSDTLMVFGLLLTIAGLVGGNIRATARVGGVKPEVIRRARRLSEAAALVAQDHAQAVDAVRTAWAPLHRERVDEELGRLPVARLPWGVGGRLRAMALEKAGVRTVRDVLGSGVWELAQLPGVGQRTAESAVAAAQRVADEASEGVAVRIETDRPGPRTTALLVALRVLVEAGPGAREAAEAGEALAARLEPLLTDASAASSHAEMLRAGPTRRRLTRAAVAKLSLQLETAERDGATHQFGQASVDLLRGPDNDRAGLSVWVDFESRPTEYSRVLVDITGHRLSWTRRPGAADLPRPTR